MMTGAFVVVLGFMIATNRVALQQAIFSLPASLGVTAPRAAIDAAYDAYQSNDFEAALQIAKPLAEQGNARAQSLLGLIYNYGRHVPKDQAEATKWFRRAADQGDSDAQFYLGLMYATGRGVPQNFAEATKWYRLAADGGNAQAQYNLGVLYFNGDGVPQSSVKAHMWFNLAAAHFPASDRRNRDQAARVRDVVAMKMTPQEIAQAQQQAREWKPR